MVEDEVLVSPHRFEDNTHMFLYALVFILYRVWAYNQMLYTPKYRWFNEKFESCIVLMKVFRLRMLLKEFFVCGEIF